MLIRSDRIDRRCLITLTIFAIVLIDVIKTEILTPPYFNLAEKKKITATATCGVDSEGPELYCKLVGANAENDIDVNLIQGQYCDVCDPKRMDKMHPPEFAIDGRETWWQSPPLSRGMKYNEVNLTIDLGQEFHVAYVYIRMGNSPRPGLWVLEKSADYGQTFTAWQYFSDLPSDCERFFGRESLLPITKDDSVICSTEFSKIVPLEGGEIPISLLNNRPSSNHYFNSSVLQEWTRATNVRIRLLRTKTLLGHLMSVTRQDPTVTRRYFYSIKDISIGGRCMCNGHADTCYSKNDTEILICQCRHNTCGDKCEVCCTGFEQKAWRQSKSYHLFECEPCNCFSHSNECVYDLEVDRKHQSLDIYGKYEGGGVCLNCQHNTEGINCNKCKDTFYKPYNKHWNETDVCQPCNCNYHYSTGNCEQGSGRCECRREFQPPLCDSCSFGHYGYPNCRECDCFLNGTHNFQCEPTDGRCPCLSNYGGKTCRICADGYFNFPECEACQCDSQGSASLTCNQISGNCTCKANYGDKHCDKCKDGFYDYPTCKYCNCDVKGTKDEICDKTSGRCICKEGYGGSLCDQCSPGYYGYPDCKPCNCSTIGSQATNCDNNGKCHCLDNFGGRTCDSCSPGYYKYPECQSCNCDSQGTIGLTCNEDGVCNCEHNFDGEKCNKCKDGFYNFPVCEGCNCHPAGVVAGFEGCGSVPAGELCKCKERVEGRICNKCKELYWNLNLYNPDGCEECRCNVAGVLGGVSVCDSDNGQCVCKPSVIARGCTECDDGTYNLQKDNLFGCSDCGCDIGGSVNTICDKLSGQCLCQSRVTGLTCKEPIPAHYFPTLFQYQYEIENGRTPENTVVRYLHNEAVFPDYSWRGYVEFTMPQTEVLQDIYISKPSLYRLVLRYINPNSEIVTGTIKVIPDNPTENEQINSVQFKPSQEPAFVTVSGDLGNAPTAFILNPGRWTISIKVDKNVLLDYSVLIPEDFYLATLLSQKVEAPCKIDQNGLCRQFTYPSVSSYGVKWGAEHTDVLGPGYQNEHHLSQMTTGCPYTIPILGKNQADLVYNITVSKPGHYVIVIEYVTPIDDDRSYTIDVIGTTKNASSRGRIEFDNCHYTTFCRQIVANVYDGLEVYNVVDNDLSIKLVGKNANVGIISLTPIPIGEWSYDFIQPRPVCIKKGNKCVASTFITPSESKKYRFDYESEKIVNNRKPVIISNVTYVQLNRNDSTIEIDAKVQDPGYYVLVLKFHQPFHTEFGINASIVNLTEGRFIARHCPSISGCRTPFVNADGGPQIYLYDNFTTTLKIPDDTEVFLDYLMVIPYDLYNIHVLEEQNLNRASEFISTCGNNHFYIDTTVDGFCKDSVFSITAGYNNGALPCQCDYEGSLSFECDKFGGQCKCKSNVIGRQCESCRTGYFGFPGCKPCNCTQAAFCEAHTGQCICPKFVVGKDCDQCMPNTYNYDRTFGCEECNCDPLGIERSLQCDLITGSCSCKPHIVGRNCSMCDDGYFSFPYCEKCECDLAGTTHKICDKNSAECFCKKNAIGPACNMCRQGTFNLQENDEDGCTQCFCFGKTSRCESSGLIRTQTVDMRDWGLVTIDETIELNVSVLNTSLHDVNDETIGADLTIQNLSNRSVYFASPPAYLGKKLTTYGGVLNYSIFYTSGPSGKAIRGADVILQSSNMYISHYSMEQPAAAINFNGAVELVDINFELPDGTPAKREHVMQVLKDLRGLYIRASYWTDSITTRLSNVLMDDAVPYSSYYQGDIESLDFASSVERCMCPENYQGLSCEECAPGFYRSTGPFGGYCVPCQCNGHADECDVNTGKCMNCMHNTRGDHCELCDVGYHGNALQGTPMDCLICACPLPIASNNFATGCEVNAEGDKISCDCRSGYIGGRCQSCGPGLYGKPDVPGDYCKPCQCSGNINPLNPDSCDTVTGACLECLNNTSGNVCQFCKPGFYGDAVRLKNCQACICDETGTDHCDHETGVCVCRPNVIGEKCDRCKLEHYGFQSGQGCVPCQCGEASYSGQCDDVTGQCRCKPGVTGRTCERCAAGYWNYTSDGCISCECRTEYSSGFSCDVSTGQCKCLKNVSGEKCEHCPHRWVFIEDYGCEPCDNCVHSLMDTTDELRQLIDPIIEEYGSADSGYFTTRRLVHINDTIKRLNPRLDNLDPDKINLTPIFKELEGLEQDSKNVHRKSNYSLDDSRVISENSDNLREEAVQLLRDIAAAEENVEITIKDIDDLTLNITEGEGTKIDSAVQEALRLLDQIKGQNITNYEIEADKNLIKTEELLNTVHEYKTPIDDILDEIAAVNDDNVILDEKLDDLLNHTNYSRNKAGEADNLYARNGKERVEKLLSNIKNHSQEADRNLNDTLTFLGNASKYLADTRNLLIQLKIEPFQLQSFVNEVNTTFEDRDNGIIELEELKPKIKEHAENLSHRAGELHGLLSETKDTSENAIKAANAYKDIVNAIKDAQAAAESSKEYVDEAAISFNKLQENSTDADSNSSNLLDDAFTSLQNVTDLEPLIHEAILRSRPIRSLNEVNKENLDNIENVIRQLQGIDPYKESLNNAVKLSENANDYTLGTKMNLQNNFKEVSNETESAKEIPKKLDDANRFVVQIEKQLSHVNEKLPILIRKVEEFPDEDGRVDIVAQNIDAEIKKLNEQIALARDLADRIKVGLKFRKETTLELRNPPNLQDLSTSTYISGYFRTASPYGLLLYLGNGNGTNLKRTKTDDYMALEIENGYPALTLDIGNGPQRILNDKYVATDEWHQFIIDRVGMNVKLIIKEELPDHSEQVSPTEVPLNGHYSIFNLDRNQSKLFMGSYPLEFNMQDTIRTNSFEGEVEDLIIGDRPVSLWNFNHGQNNNEGAKERNKFVNLRPSTGYRFNGNGYAILNARSFNLRSRADIQLKFKTFASEGLIFLIGKDGTFISIEIRNGRVVYQYNLGHNTKTWSTTKAYDDGLWHKVTASREGPNGRFAVDNEEVRDATRPISGVTIAGADTMVFGGYPQSHEFVGDVTNVDYDGCIDEVYITGRPVDLSENIKAYGVTPGCPVKLTRLVSFETDRPGYVNRDNVSISNDFRINLKFKTKEKDGIIFYVTDRMQNGGISLSLVNDRLKLISQKIELISDENNFNDSEWHVVSVQHNSKILRFDVDDYGFKVTDSPPDLHLLYGNMYIGGIPPAYVDRTGSLGTKKAFAGCIGDATLGGAIIDFSNSTDKRNEILGKCILDKSVGSDSDIHRVPELPPIDEIDEITEEGSMGVTIDPLEAEIPKRGDGGSDRGSPDEDDIETGPDDVFTEPPESEEITEVDEVHHLPQTTEPPRHSYKPSLVPLPFDTCVLPLEPAKDDIQEGSYQFGASGRSWLEYYIARGKFRKHFDFSFEFKTNAEEGVLFYASDQIHSQFVGVFLKNAHVVFVFDGRHGLLRLRSNAMYNDNKWHSVIFSRYGPDGKLVIDDELVDLGKTSGNTIKVELNTPFYLGGFNPEFDVNVSYALNTTAQYVGCIRNFSMNGKPMESPKEHGIMPCSENVELGVYFGSEGGYVKLEERYNVGLEILINMDIKPRTTSGLLISAHGKHHYLILELLDGNLKFTMYNGKQPITTSYVPKTKYYFCDGNWHHIQAVKSKSVVSLSVDKISSEPGVGDIHRSNTHTTGSLFLGGHRLMSKIKGLESRRPFVGCMKNIVIKEKTYVLNRDMVSGAVTLGSCPTN